MWHERENVPAEELVIENSVSAEVWSFGVGLRPMTGRDLSAHSCQLIDLSMDRIRVRDHVAFTHPGRLFALFVLIRSPPRDCTL